MASRARSGSNCSATALRACRATRNSIVGGRREAPALRPRRRQDRGRALRGRRRPRAAEALRGSLVEVDRSALPPLEEGEYYHVDLIGLAGSRQRRQPVGLSSRLRITAPAIAGNRAQRRQALADPVQARESPTSGRPDRDRSGLPRLAADRAQSPQAETIVLARGHQPLAVTTERDVNDVVGMRQAATSASSVMRHSRTESPSPPPPMSSCHSVPLAPRA